MAFEKPETEINNMNQSTGQRIRRGMNFLSMLGAKLRDLQGTATLAHELIQNAEDAVGRIDQPEGQAATMTFRIDEKALIVENEGIFSDCGDPHRQPCVWDTPCDFHGFTDVGSGRKRLAEKQKGAFGFGFTAVYQMTDHPEVISSGRHWILEDDKPEDQRILECGGCENCQGTNLPGTRFILPWAYDRTSSVRQALKVAAVPEDGPQRFLEELLADLPHTLLFLDHIKTIKVFWKDQLKLSVSRTPDPECESAITIVQNGEATKWMLLATEFEDRAAQLIATHPPGEKKPISTVKIAVPNDTSRTGLFFAFLPTQQPTGFPFHINADFFPTNDRKRILLESDYQAEWNREAIRTAAVALEDGLLELRSFLGPKAFWQLLEGVHRLSTAESYAANPLCQDYWEQLVPTLQSEEVIPTSTGQWVTASRVRYLRRKTDDDTAALYRALGIQTVNADLNEFGHLLTSEAVRVRELDAEALASAMRIAGLSGSKQLSQMPTWFQEIDHWEILWSRLKSFAKSERKTQGGSVWERVGDDWKMLGTIGQHHATHNPLAHCALVKCTDGTFRNCCDVYVADPDTRRLFEVLKPSFHFADDNEGMIEAVEPLCDVFTLEDAVGAAESADSSDLEQHFRSLLKWLCDHSGQLHGNANLIARIRALPICPTASGLRPFSTVVLPGGFSDPVGVTDLVEENSIAGLEPLLRILGLDRLSLREYITERLPEAFSAGDVDAEAAEQLVELLAGHQGEFLNDEDIREELASLPFISCEDGAVRSSDDGLYFRTELVQDVLDDSVCYVSTANSTTAICNFLAWLGVSSEPDLERVTNYVIDTASSADVPNAETIEKVQSLFEHLGSRLEEIRRHEEILQTLRSEKWLPASSREWCSESKKWIPSKTVEWATPQDTHLGRRHYLVESIAKFLRFPTRVQDHYREFLDELGVIDTPRPIDVVRHLTNAAGMGTTIDRRLYQFLDRALDDGFMTEQQLGGLKDSPCLYDAERQACVKPSHCFTEKHPFKNYRVELTGDTLSSFTNLLKALSVRSEPTWKDAIDVLREIAESELVSCNRAVSDADKQVVLACWRMIESALRNEEEYNDAILRQIESIAKQRVVCRPDNLMSEPAKVFFRDREHLAEAFSDQLGATLIPIPQRAAEALAQAGVQKLSEVTTTEILFDELPPQTSVDVTSRLKERASLLMGVMETCKANRSQDIPDFEHQAVSETTRLVVQHSFNGFSRPILSNRHAVLAIFDNKENHLYYCREEGSIPWDTIACELARMFLGSGDVPQLSAQISAVLEPDTLQKARRKLSRLGFPDIELVEDEPDFGPTASSFGLGEISEGKAEQVEPPSSRTIPAGTLQANSGTTQPASRDETHPHTATTTPESDGGGLKRFVTGRSQTGSPHGQATTGDNGGRQQSSGQQGEKSTERKDDTSSRVFAPFEFDGDDDFGGFDDDIPFIEELANRKGGTDRRRDKVAAESDGADRRRSELVWRQQRVNRIPKGEVEHYLRSYYSRDGRLYCQMRHVDEPDLHRMPFRKKNGEECWVRVELLNGKWAHDLTYTLPEYKCLFVLLCPNCAALYTEFVRNLDAQQDKLFEWFATTDETEFEVKCSLRGKQPDRVLHFDPKHLADIRAVEGVKASNK